MRDNGSKSSHTAEGFVQEPPRLANSFHADPLLQEFLARAIPRDPLEAIRGELVELGDLSVELSARQLADRENEPRLTRWDPWGRRVDAIELTPLWREARRIAAERGLIAIAYERALGEHSRVHQFAANYLVQASLDFYSCPLAMTDGAARTLCEFAEEEIVQRAVPHLTTRNPAEMWTSGQWMTERAGGSDVGLTETVARRTADGWRLHGAKWFASAVSSEMALTLARPEGNPAGSRGLALFYVETRDSGGMLRGITIDRLKDKLGTRKVPTAEITLDGTPAVPVRGTTDGVRHIAPMLTVTRVWNSVGAAWLARRAVALARDYATRRSQFGSLLRDKPLHAETLASLEVETRALFLLAFRAVVAIGRVEAGTADDGETLLLRVLTPLAKLVTAKQSVAIVSEGIECFGGAGYVEDTGLPAILRDAHVLPIWEGTTNVLALDLLRALADQRAVEALSSEVERRCASARDAALRDPAARARDVAARALEWLSRAEDVDVREGGARRLALDLGYALELALLVDHAQWLVDETRPAAVAVAAARRFARRHDSTLVERSDLADSRAVLDVESV